MTLLAPLVVTPDFADPRRLPGFWTATNGLGGGSRVGNNRTHPDEEQRLAKLGVTVLAEHEFCAPD
jgi:hypothetical protein